MSISEEEFLFNLFGVQCAQTEAPRSYHQCQWQQHPSEVFLWLQPTKTYKVLEMQSISEPTNNKEHRFTQEPLRTLSEKSWILSRTFQTSGTTFFPLLCIVASLAARRATCSTALFSVLFIYRPQETRIERIINFYFLQCLRLEDTYIRHSWTKQNRTSILFHADIRYKSSLLLIPHKIYTNCKWKQDLHLHVPHYTSDQFFPLDLPPELDKGENNYYKTTILTTHICFVCWKYIES